MTNATVIKADTLRSQPAGARAFNLNDYRAAADALLKSAEAEAVAHAERIRKAAETRAAELLELRRREGYEKGYADGVEKGRAEALKKATEEFQSQHASAVAAMQQVMETFDAQRRDWVSATRRDAVELAMEIAARIVKRIGAVDREAAVANLRDVIDRVGHGRDLTVFVHPDDATTIRQFADALTDAEKSWGHVRIAEDARIEPGGCRVDADGGALDATLTTQLDRIADELIPWRNART